jgi:hypothetical protein
MKTEMEAARQAGKSFNYGGSGDPLSGLIAEVTVICEREAATKPGGTCAEAKDTLAKFRGTVEQACKSDAAWCRASQEELRGVIERTSQTCEREQVVSTPPRQPRPRTASRPRRPPAARVAPQPTGPSPEDVAAAAAIAAGIATIIGGMQRPRGPVYQPPASAPPPRCHYGPDGRLHCGRG